MYSPSHQLITAEISFQDNADEDTFEGTTPTNPIEL